MSQILRNPNPPLIGVRTAADVRKDFFARGETVTGWASRHGFERHAVYAVLSGRTVGRRGAAHRIAVALGIKAAPELMPEPIEPAAQVPAARQALKDALRCPRRLKIEPLCRLKIEPGRDAVGWTSVCG